MNKRIITIILALAAVCGGAVAQQKQGHVMRPKPRSMGKTTVIGQAQLEVEYDGMPPTCAISTHISTFICSGLAHS